MSMPPGLGTPDAFGWVALVAWVPLLSRWRTHGTPERSVQEALLMGSVAGMVAFGWGVQHPFWPAALASVGVVALWALSLAVPWAAGAAFVRRGAFGRAYAVWIAAALALDALWSMGPWALPWGRIGHALAAVPVVPWLVAGWGVGGLSACVLLGNALATELWLAYRAGATPGESSLHSAAGVRALVLGSLLAGLVGHAVMLNRIAFTPARDGRHAAATQPTLFLVQPGTSPHDWAALDAPQRVSDLQALTNAALDTAATPPALAVWPETALPPVHHDSLRHRVQQWVNRTGVPLLTGAIAPVSDSAASLPEGPYRHANRLYLLRPHKPVQAYDKHHLVPFVERVPGASVLSALGALAVSGGGVAGYRRGPGPQTLGTGGLRIAPLICLESVVGPYVWRAVQQALRPHVLITASHTGWWNSPRPGRQHLAFSRLRSLETGTPLALVTVRGPTALVYPDGRLSRRLPWTARGVLAVALPAPRPPPSPVRIGPLAWLGIGGLLLALAGIPWRRLRKCAAHWLHCSFAS